MSSANSIRPATIAASTAVPQKKASETKPATGETTTGFASFIYEDNDTILNDTELEALRKLYPTLTDDELKSLKNPGAAYQYSFLQWKQEQQAQEEKIRTNELGLKNLQSSVFSNVSSIFEQAMGLAKQNRQQEALQLIQSAAPLVNNGLSSLSGSGTEGVDESTLNSIQGQYTGLTKTVGEMRHKLLSVNLTDEELLKTTGKDLNGQSELENTQERLKFQPIATISQRELDEQSPFFSLQNSSPTGFEEFRRKALTEKNKPVS